MSQNARINTDLFPKKFSGSEADVKIIDIWINRFSTAVSLNSIDGEKAIEIFRLWTEGLAAEWQNDMEAISDTTEWTLKDWLDKLKTKFVKKTDQKGNIFALLKLNKQEEEDIEAYNNRFRNGSEADVKIIDIWINRFSTAVSLNSIDGEKAIEIFRLWTEGLAAEWQNDMEAISDTTEWTLKDWLDKLKTKFVKKTDQKGNIFALLKLNKQEEEDIEAYNNRFRKYVSTIPSDMKTDGLIKKIYSDLLLHIDKDLWWSYSKLDEKSDLVKLMKVTSKVMDIKEQA
ncbi:hypothetical protein AYI68_g3638 [Smittium mucronatum]|uniref:Ty3 transposon capsid-like protein domain-containing protein n=1 Tax=Smittium mucronatum TaxID=133383 RepID=A0A1R0GZA4_9FUNG|nr:hypothetical protein AYI68_g3638 [Smittium mucronatum]